MSTPTTDGHDRRFVVITTRPRCPRCGSTRLRAYRSTRAADGTVTRHSRCRDCGASGLVIAK